MRIRRTAENEAVHVENMAGGVRWRSKDSVTCQVEGETVQTRGSDSHTPSACRTRPAEPKFKLKFSRVCAGADTRLERHDSVYQACLAIQDPQLSTVLKRQ